MSSVPAKISRYSVPCGVCFVDFDTKEKWVRHVFETTHQKLTRGCQNWLGKIGESRVLVTTCQAEGLTPSILQFFMSYSNSIIDLIQLKGSACVCLILFESKAKLDEVLSTLGCVSEIRISGNSVKLQKGEELSEVELCRLFPECAPTASDSSSVTNPVAKTNREIKTEKPAGTEQKRPAITSPCTGFLRTQFESVRQIMEIPDIEYKSAMQIINGLNELFQPLYPTFKAAPFRNWFLKLHDPTNTDNNDMLICAYLTDGGTSKARQTLTRARMEEIILTSPKGRKIFANVTKRHTNPKDEERSPAAKQFGSSNVLQLKHPDGFLCSIVLTRRLLFEAQLCGLLRYMCSFDARCVPLLAMVRYWARVNRIRFGKARVCNELIHLLVPTPASLDWLVMTFLVGVKLVPTPRQIRSREHEPLLATEDIPVDIGFNADPMFTQEWWTDPKRVDPPPEFDSDEFYLSILQLAQQFFACHGDHFYQQNSLINTLDGELQNLLSFMGGKKPGDTNLTDDEINILMKLQSNKDIRIRLNLTTTPLHVLNPLWVGSSLHVRIASKKEFTRISRFMRATGDELESFLRKADNGERDTIDLKEYLKVQARYDNNIGELIDLY